MASTTGSSGSPWRGRCSTDGRPGSPDRSSSEDRDGAPLDLHRRFRLDDDPDEISHFLEEAGFLHLEGVFEPDEMDAISRDMDTAAPGYAPDDGNSWWARTGSGEHRPVRLQRFQEHSPATAELLRDPIASCASASSDAAASRRARGAKATSSRRS